MAQSRDGVFTWIHADHLSSATRITDVNGLEIRRLAYTSFGEEAENQGTGDDPKYKYTGKEADATGLYYYSARYYDPALCRFITADTVYDVGPQGLNRYSYALNNPIIYRDPTGHQVNPFEVMFRGLRNSPVGKLIGNRMRSEAQGVAEAVKKQIVPPEGTGMAEGAVPIWGDAKDSYLAFEQGSVTYGCIYACMAINDLADGGVSPEDAAKAGLKGGQEVLEKATKEGGEKFAKEGIGLIDEVGDGVEGASKKIFESARTKWKGFRKGSLKSHYQKHVIEQGEFGKITQNEYLKRAKSFAAETASNIKETQVGNIIVKHDPDTGRVLIGNVKNREIRTFYIDDGRTADAFESAVEYAKGLTGK